MKTGIVVLVLTLFSMPAWSQQEPQYTQYFQNMAMLNPAVTGMYHSLNVRAGFRNQWTGLEDAPKTRYFTINTPINRGDSRSGFNDFGIYEPETRSQADKQHYRASFPHHAVGIVGMNDQTGALTRTTLNLTYAYHIDLSSFSNLAFGVGAGFNRLALNTSKLRFDDPLEPVTASGNSQTWSPDVNAGVYFYSSTFYLGGVIQQALNYKLSFAENYKSGKEVPHYFLMSGLTMWFREDFSITPSVVVKFLQPAPVSFDVNMRVAYLNKLWIGGSYRAGDSFAAIAGFSVAKAISLGYGYDYSISPLRNVSSGSHEVVLGINF
jgi:type IX secretion system PorP/SprF family membrane protein